MIGKKLDPTYNVSKMSFLCIYHGCLKDVSSCLLFTESKNTRCLFDVFCTLKKETDFNKAFSASWIPKSINIALLISVVAKLSVQFFLPVKLKSLLITKILHIKKKTKDLKIEEKKTVSKYKKNY